MAEEDTACGDLGEPGSLLAGKEKTESSNDCSTVTLAELSPTGAVMSDKADTLAELGPTGDAVMNDNANTLAELGPTGDAVMNDKSSPESADGTTGKSDGETSEMHTNQPSCMQTQPCRKPNTLPCSGTMGSEKGSNGNKSSASDGENVMSVEGAFVQGMMKKDDSGIDIEKSPSSIKDISALSDGDGSVSESFFTDSAACSRTNSVSESKLYDQQKSTVAEAQELLAESVGCDIDGEKAFCTELENVSTEIQDQRIRENSRDIDDSSDAGMHSSESAPSRRRRQRSSSTSSDFERTDDESKSKKSATSETEGEEPEFYAMEDHGESPKHHWCAMPEIRHREIGKTNKMSSLLFQERVSGCLRMVQRLELMAKLDYHEGCVNTLSFNRIGTLLASGSDDLNIVLWNWVRSKPVLIFDSGHRANVFQAKFMPYSGDCHVISCARDGQVRLAELSLTGICKGTKKLAQHKGAAHKLALEYDSPHTFLSCGEDAVMFEVDLRTDKPNKLGTTKENDRKVALYSIHSNPSYSFEYCVGGRDHYIRVYDKRKIDEEVNGGVLKKYCPHHLLNSDVKANVTCACYNYNGTELLGTYNDEDIYLFDSTHSDGAEFIHRYKGHRNNATVKGVNFYGPKSQFIVSGSDCGHVYLWDKLTENVVQYMEGDVGGVVNVLEAHPQAPILATSGLDHDIKIWAPSAQEATKLKGLRKIVRKNRRDRIDERTNEPEMIDGQMLWFLMHHLRRSARRRARQDGEEVSSSSENSRSESEGEEEEPNLHCVPS